MTYSTFIPTRRTANEEQRAKEDAAQLLQPVANPNVDFSKAVDTAAQLDQRRLAALVVHLTRTTLQATVGFEVMTNVAESLEKHANRPGVHIAPAPPQTPALRAQQQARIRHAYAIGQENARLRRLAKETAG